MILSFFLIPRELIHSTDCRKMAEQYKSAVNLNVPNSAPTVMILVPVHFVFQPELMLMCCRAPFSSDFPRVYVQQAALNVCCLVL
jgi:hypothetical protein